MSDRTSFDEYARLWVERIQQLDPEVSVNWDDSPHLASATTAFNGLLPTAHHLLSLYHGTEATSDPTYASAIPLFNFFPRFFKVPSSAHIPEPHRSRLTVEIQTTFMLGLVTHLLLCKSPVRDRITRLDGTILLRDVVPKMLIAGRGMRQAYREILPPRLRSLTEQLQANCFKASTKPYLQTTFNLGFFSSTRLGAHFQDIFWSGPLLAMRAETLAR